MKKFLIGFLVFCLVLCMFPTVVFAKPTRKPGVNPSISLDVTASPEEVLIDVDTEVTYTCTIKNTGGCSLGRTDVNRTFVKKWIDPGKNVEIKLTATIHPSNLTPIVNTFTVTAESWMQGKGDWVKKPITFTTICSVEVVAPPDKTAPDVEITAPKTYLVSGIIEIRGSIVDDNPHHYWLTIVNSEGTKIAGPGTVNETNSLTDTSLFSWDTTLIPDGIYTIKLEARDVAGNKDSGSVDWVKVEVDNVLPEPEPEPEPEPIIPESEPCYCSLIVQIRDENGNAINGAVLKVNGIEKKTVNGDARWDNLKCDISYTVRELSPVKYTKEIHLGSCGERSTMRIVNKIGKVVEPEVTEPEILRLPETGQNLLLGPFLVLSGLILTILSGNKRKED